MIYLELFLTFFKIGAFTFGGGYAMLPLIQEAVLEKGWADAESLIDFVAVSESTPGPFAVNLATYVGSDTAGIPGALCATLGVVLPSFIVILIVAGFYERFRSSFAVRGVMSGLKPAVVGLIGAAALSVFVTVFLPDGLSVSLLSSPVLYISAALFAVSVLLSQKKAHPVMIILISALIGVGCGYIFNL
ncbi:MAG: chromate transporter [Clostridia bacterium]|nr:chromate transporter [Clostridia bacterium]